jgi:hypothetical protein
MTSPFLENLVKWEREHTKGAKYTHPDCNHQCTSNCRREGCNCLCGEYHGQLDLDEYNEIIKERNCEYWQGSEKCMDRKAGDSIFCRFHSDNLPF